MSTIPERLDWLWFFGYDLDDDIGYMIEWTLFMCLISYALAKPY